MIGSGYIIIFLLFVVLSWLVGARLKSKFRQYSKMPLNYGISGKEVAEKMLHENGIHDVKVVSVQGQLSDHYNPATKTVNLSQDVYNGRSIASAAVAAHECGHAIQHAKAYSMLQFRTALVPVQNISSKIINVIFTLMFFGVFAFNFINLDIALYVVIGCYGIFTLFAFVTLPVEIDASNRALMWLNSAGITGYGTHEKAKDALKWAAYTYVVAALSSLAMLLYFVFMLLGRRD
ncbi:MAG: zinc metallopeptidase [Bacteroidales bacterium]|nr:zinc metallopeptidase [Bacteroidales bacterium]